MSTATIQPEANPFAAPQTSPQAAGIQLSSSEDYRIVGDVLYCRPDTDLSHVCWLTGETKSVISRRRIVNSFSVSCLPNVVLVPFLTCGILGAIVLAGGYAIPILLIFFILKLGMKKRKQVALIVGETQKAVNSRLAEQIIGCLNVVFLVSLIVVSLKELATYPQFSMTLVICSWILGSIALHVWLKPKSLRPRLSLCDDSSFAIRGLSAEFLTAVALLQHNQSGKAEATTLSASQAKNRIAR